MSADIIKLPRISDQELLAKYYSMADLFLICSKKENFPTTCVEAQCCGTPVIGFDTGGTRETSLLNEKCFVNYGDVEGVVNLIREKINTKFPNLELKAHKEYSSESMAENYLHYYDSDGIKKRVLLIDVNCKKSSTGKIVYDLYKYLRNNNRDAAVCYGRGEKIKEENIYKFGIDIETNLHAAAARIIGVNGVFSYFSTLRLIKFIKKYKPDLIHIHELHAYFVNIKMLLKYLKKTNIKIVWTFHCEYMYTGKCGYTYECEKYKTGCGHCPHKKDYPKSVFFDFTKSMYKTKKKLLDDLDFDIFTPSLWLKSKVEQSFLSKKNCFVIHNGIDTSIFCKKDTTKLKEKLGIPLDKKIVLAVAPNLMDERKGGKFVIEIADKMENENIVFIMVGID